jgi:hypothetical protein
MALDQQCTDHMGSDESRSSGNKNFFGHLLGH